MKKEELGGILDMTCPPIHIVWMGLLSPFLIGRMFLREPSWKYSVKLVGS